LEKAINFAKVEIEDQLDAHKIIGLEVNDKKTQYNFMSRTQNADQNRDTNIAVRTIKNVGGIKCMDGH
jgi:hypothetical protein